MEFYLYNYKFTFSESALCEGKAKAISYRLSSEVSGYFNELYNSNPPLEDFFKYISKRYQNKILETAKVFVDLLHSEGIYTVTESSYINMSHVNDNPSFPTELLRLRGQSSITRSMMNDLIYAAMDDINPLWKGYFLSHGYRLSQEIFLADGVIEALSIMTNIRDGKVPKDTLRRCFVDALVRAPFIPDGYHAANAMLGNDNGNLIKLGKFFDIEIDENDIYADGEDAGRKYFGADYSHIRAEYGRNLYFVYIQKLLNDKDLLEIATTLYEALVEETKEKGYLYCKDVGYKFDSKAENALETYAKVPHQETIIFVYDNTAIGYADDGFVITDVAFYYKGGRIPLADVKYFGKGDKERGFNHFRVNDINIYCGSNQEKNIQEIIQMISIFIVIAQYNRKPINAPSQESLASKPQHRTSIRVDVESALNNLRQQYPKYNFKSHIYYCFDGGEKINRKLNGAMKEYAHLSENEMPILLYDSTVMGGGEDGLLVTSRGVYIHNVYQPAIFIEHRNIRSITVKGMFAKDLYINDTEVKTSGMDNDQIIALKEMIEFVCNEC